MRNQSIRVISLFLKISILMLLNLFAFGNIWPSINLKGFWFYAALMNIILGSEIVTPFYTRPADALAYSVAAIVAIVSVPPKPESTQLYFLGFNIVLVSCILILLFSLASILLKDSNLTVLNLISNVLRIVLEYIGSPKAVFSILFLFAAIAFHSSSIIEFGAVSVAWGLTVISDPIAIGLEAYNRIRSALKKVRSIQPLGAIAAYQQPNVVLIREQKIVSHDFAAPILLMDSRGDSKIGVTLDHVGREQGILLRCLTIFTIPKNSSKIPTQILELDNAYLLSSTEVEKYVQKIDAFHTLAGIVCSETTIDALEFEVIQDIDLYEGRLVAADIHGNTVLYQILDGITREEIVDKKNTFGYLRVTARKVGHWNSAQTRFERVKWLPQINTPVFLAPGEDFIPYAPAIGHFPGTNFTVEISDINALVTHNTAILGILGIGKSMLAIEIVERIIAEDIRVLCLDLTQQYQGILSPYLDIEDHQASIDSIKEAGHLDIKKWADNPDQGGSVPNFREAIYNDIKSFLQNEKRLKIYNPAELIATKQLSEPRSFQSSGSWQRNAALYFLTPVEITQIIAETCLELLSDAMSSNARLCLVFEEAHALIPEWNTVVQEGDKTATSGTARAILQGRKYGLGCLLVTQRTANVTKTILNQCNSIFAMRTFDNTGIDFLANYIGNDYASVLSTLPERHAVYFGKSSSCENPVLIRLNDRKDFISAFHNPNLESPEQDVLN